MTRFTVCLIAIVLAGCKREWRDLTVDPSRRIAPSLSYRESDLIPGRELPIPSGHTTSVLPRVNPYEGNAYAISEGQVLYGWFNCSGCHGVGGGGSIGPALIDQNWLYGQTPEQIYESISRGRPNGMPAWGTRLPEYQIWYLVSYVRAIGKLQPSAATPPRTDAISPSSERPRRPSEDEEK